MATKNNWRSFRKQARAHAARLEDQAATARLVAMAEDPLDALAILWDVSAYRLHEATARIARLHGDATSQAPAPVSRLLSGFSEQLRDKCAAVAEHLKPDEIDRLGRISPGFVAALQANDFDVMLLVRDLLPRSPEVIASWLQTHLDSVETRFAS